MDGDTMRQHLVIALLLLAACAQTPTGQVVAEEQPQIGGLFGLTGYAAFAGEAARNGFIMAIEDSGMNVTYVIEDHESSLTGTVTAATKLRDVDAVDIIIGPEWNEFGEVISPLAYNGDILFLSPWMTGDDEWVAAPYYFTATASERHQLQALARHMAAAGDTDIVVVYARNAWSEGNANTFRSVAEKLTIVQEFSVDEQTMDYRTLLKRIQALQPDGIYVVLPTDSGQAIFNKQYYELGLQMQLYIPFSRAESDVLQQEHAEYSKGIIYPAPAEYERAEIFRAKYEERFGETPGAISAATAYDLTTLVLEAMRAGARTPDEVRNHLMNASHEGYSNMVAFNTRGQLATETVVIKRTNGTTPEIV